MFVIVWEFEPKEGKQREFERVYGPAGDWAKLFARSAEYQGTELLRPAAGTRYLTIDRWSSAEAFAQFHERWPVDYATLDRECEPLMEREAIVGRFETR